MIDADLIERARSVRIEHELARRGVKLRGRVDRCGPCPRCGGDDRFSVHIGDQVFYCRRCGGKGRGAIDLVIFLDGCDFSGAVTYLGGETPERTVCSIAKQCDKVAKQLKEELPGTGKFAATLWRVAVDPHGTLIERYLKSRALELPDGLAREAIRFHPACPFMAERLPAMICLVRNISTDEPQAIHRTALAADGTAIKRNGKT